MCMQFCKNGEHSSQICQDYLFDLFQRPAERKWIQPDSAMMKALQWYQRANSIQVAPNSNSIENNKTNLK